jgi:hypothetical protein
MNEYAAKEVFSQAEKFLKTARVPEHVQVAMQESVGKSREFYSKAAAGYAGRSQGADRRGRHGVVEHKDAQRQDYREHDRKC